MHMTIENWKFHLRCGKLMLCRMLGLSVDTANLDTYSMRSKEQVDEDMKMYYHILRNLHNKE